MIQGNRPPIFFSWVWVKVADVPKIKLHEKFFIQNLFFNIVKRLFRTYRQAHEFTTHFKILLMKIYNPTSILKFSLFNIFYVFIFMFVTACSQKDAVNPNATGNKFIGVVDGAYIRDVPEGSALKEALGNHFKDFIAANFRNNGKDEILSREIVRFGEDIFIKTKVAFTIGKPVSIFTKLKKDINSRLVATPQTLVCTNSLNCPGNGCVLTNSSGTYGCYCSLGSPGTANCLLIAEE
jgi:hypothetical protein